jgi:hypothetical protein
VVVPAVYRSVFIPRGPLGIHGPRGKSGGTKLEGPRDFISPAFFGSLTVFENLIGTSDLGGANSNCGGNQCARLINDGPVIGGLGTPEKGLFRAWRPRPVRRLFACLRERKA